jgi:hypothetical protein
MNVINWYNNIRGSMPPKTVYKKKKDSRRFHACKNDSTARSLGENAMPARFNLMNSTLASIWNQRCDKY